VGETVTMKLKQLQQWGCFAKNTMTMTMKKALELSGIVLGFLGTIFVFFALQINSSDFRIVHSPDPSRPGVIDESLCFGTSTMITVSPGESGVGVTTHCPIQPGDQPTAVVNTNNPILAYLGLVFLGCSFILQFVAACIEPRQLSRAERLRSQI
jgi:hypothetical protein